MSIAYEIPSPRQYLDRQHKLYNHAEKCGCNVTCNLIMNQTNSFIDCLIESDKYHMERKR